MPSNKKLLQAAAGSAGGDPLYVEDVFSTYLYDGTGVPQTIQNGINLGSSLGGPSTNFVSGQKLSRASNLTGNAQTKQMTFSCWVFWEGPNGGYIFFLAGTYVRAEINSDGSLSFLGLAAGAADTLQMQTPAGTIPLNSWTNILFSFDLASTSNRYLYINDVAVTPTYTHYVNQLFNNDAASQSGPSPSSSTSYAHLLVDYNYIDLSVTSNRRNFITADLQPAAQATQEALNPIIYLPMTTSTPETNAGTGGAFTATNSPVFNETFGPSDSSEAGEGGMVWNKLRNFGSITNTTYHNHWLTDTVRGAGQTALNSNTSDAAGDSAVDNVISSFNSDGFTLTSIGSVASGSTSVSWTFRKAEKFFDVVTYTGNGVDGRQIAHNLGSTPAMIIGKKTSGVGSWKAYHESLGATKYLRLDGTNAAITYKVWGDTAPTDSVFTLGVDSGGGLQNDSGATYVAYLFASDAGGFGEDGDENIIKCGSYTGTGATGLVVDLGFEPQWVMIKRATGSTGDWLVVDNMRDLSITSENQLVLRPNLNVAESGRAQVWPTGTGFIIGQSGTTTNAVGDTYIYMAIRRGPMKTPGSGTEVFSPVATTSATDTKITTGFPVDWQILKDSRPGTNGPYVITRLTGVSTVPTDGRTGYLRTTSTAAEVAGNLTRGWDNTGYKLATAFGGNDSIYWNFQRAPGFMDVVCYKGNGTPSNTTRRDLKHNLGVAPELAILKRRNTTSEWQVAADGKELYLNLTLASQGTYTPSSYFNATDFDVEGWVNEANNNVSGSTYIVYLFATLAGVSKVGSYTGTAADLNVDCGFTAGARFILIKRTDSTGDWYTYDSARGIVAGNDPYLLLNSTAAEVTGTDYIDPLNAGFTVTSSAPAGLNASSGTYIFLAIA
jgi:hypothetical protein